MPHWIVMRRDGEGDIHRVDGLWEAASGKEAIAQMLAKTGKTDDGHWEAQEPQDREDMMNWQLTKDSKGRPKSTDEQS
jgi:hypothetical protein